jgi:hypothetical protein
MVLGGEGREGSYNAVRRRKLVRFTSEARAGRGGEEKNGVSSRQLHLGRLVKGLIASKIDESQEGIDGTFIFKRRLQSRLVGDFGDIQIYWLALKDRQTTRFILRDPVLLSSAKKV